MARSSGIRDFVLEQLAGLGGVRARAMFGGYGIYRDDVMFALLAYDRLYFRTDDQTRDEFIARGLQPFVYEMRGRRVTLPYHEAPAEVFEEPEDMCAWARTACAAAARGRQRTRRRAR